MLIYVIFLTVRKIAISRKVTDRTGWGWSRDPLRMEGVGGWSDHSLSPNFVSQSLQESMEGVQFK